MKMSFSSYIHIECLMMKHLLYLSYFKLNESNKNSLNCEFMKSVRNLCTVHPIDTLLRQRLHHFNQQCVMCAARIETISCSGALSLLNLFCTIHPVFRYVLEHAYETTKLYIYLFYSSLSVLTHAHTHYYLSLHLFSIFLVVARCSLSVSSICDENEADNLMHQLFIVHSINVHLL